MLFFPESRSSFMFNAYLTALMLGSVHAVEVDHMVAVSVFTGLKPKIKAAASYGARWGLGHAIVVVLFGGLLAYLGFQLPDKLVIWLECFVGFALIILGCWAMRAATRFHAHLPIEHRDSQNQHHGHLHSHQQDHPDQQRKNNHQRINSQQASVTHHHSHGDDKKSNSKATTHHQHLPTAMGALHGLAGSAPVVALVPIALLVNLKQVIMYLLLFSVATTLSMTVYSVLAAVAMQSVQHNQLIIRRLTMSIAVITIAVGVGWIVKTVL